MAKENKSIIIALLVVAGALLLLVGASYTGMMTSSDKKSILNMLNKCTIIGQNPLGTPQTSSCSSICISKQQICISALNIYEVGSRTTGAPIENVNSVAYHGHKVGDSTVKVASCNTILNSYAMCTCCTP